MAYTLDTSHNATSFTKGRTARSRTGRRWVSRSATLSTAPPRSTPASGGPWRRTAEMTALVVLLVWPPVSFMLAVLVGRVIRFRDDWSL